ncbi:MAG: hypothetical protein Fur0046_26990 [Cyanobacteria bacterium J069]|nr:MAG: 2-amino-4-hydroxy-6-hydroxymethyldihydropteridine diphosphokinase [Cyanobacteria bacterium J069]
MLSEFDFPNAVRVAIALGSNLGDSVAIVESAIVAIAETPGIQLIERSHLYKTAPVGPPQPDYINACVLVYTLLPPDTLLHTLLGIEQRFGRVRRERWGARLLDLDLLLYGNRRINTPTLQLPHPRMRDRAFVLWPLAEIAPDWVEPVSNQTMAQLRDQVDDAGIQLLLFLGSIG